MVFLLLHFFFLSGFGVILPCAADEMTVALEETVASQNTPEFCSTCHSAQSDASVDRSVPLLQGQYPDYLYKQLEHFAQSERGPRNHPLMTSIAQSLNTEEKKHLSLYYGTQKHINQKTINDDILLEKGRRLYMGGDFEKHIPACAACHHPRGLGNQPASYPFLAHQNAEYLINQLQYYRSKERIHPVMNLVAKALTDEQIQSVAYYIQGLQP